MGADATLTQGAYRASRYVDLGERQAKKDLGKALSGLDKKPNVDEGGQAVKPKKKKQEEVVDQHIVEADSQADSVAEDPSMTEEELTAFREKLANKRLEYDDAAKNKDNFTQEQMMDQLDKDAGLVAKYTDNKGLNAENWGTRSKKGGKTSQRGYGLRLDGDEEAKKYLSGNITGKENQIENPDTGEMGVKGPDGKWMSMDDQRKYIESFEIDNESFNQLDETVNNYKQMGAESALEDQFDEEGASKHIRSIVSKGNMKSLAYDEGVDGVSFYSNLAGENGPLVGLKFSDLGVEQIGKDDIIDKGELSEEQRQMLAKRFIESPDHEGDLEDMLVQYNLTRTQRNYNKTKAPRIHKHNIANFNQSQGIKPLMSKPTLGGQPGVTSGSWNAMPSTPAIGSGYQEGDVVI